MLRMYVAQQCFGLSDEGIEDVIYDSQSIRAFVGIDLGRESAPDATTLPKFRHLLEANQLTRQIFDPINGHLAEKGLMMREGTIVDATLIAAPPSPKNKDDKRDAEMHQSKKGNDWLAGAVARFNLLHPQLSPMLYLDDALLDPIEHGFDLTIRVGGIPDVHALAMRPLAPCRGVLCASPDCLARHGVPQTPEDLHDHRCLHFSHLTDGTAWHFSKGEERRTVRVQAAFTANNGLVLQQAARQGLGIVYNTTFLAWRALMEGSLVPVLADWELPLNYLSALYPASRQPSPKVRALIDYLVAEYQPVPPWDLAA